MRPAWPGRYMSVTTWGSEAGRLAIGALLGQADAQHQPAHLELVGLLQVDLLARDAVHERAVGAAEILHEQLVAPEREQRVRARDRRLVQHEVGRRAASDHGARSIEGPLEAHVEAALYPHEGTARHGRHLCRKHRPGPRGPGTDRRSTGMS